MITREECRAMAVEIMEDNKNFPRDVRTKELHAAGWTSDPSGDFWLPPKATIPYRPYRNYSAWKKMREMKGNS